MKRGLVICLAVAAFLVRLDSASAQSQWVNDLIGSMVSSGFDFSEVDKLRMAKLLSEKGVVNCQVVEWGKSVDPVTMSSKERLAFLEERVKEFETKVNFVSRRLSGMVGNNEQSVNLARSIARDNDLQTILDEVMPSVQAMVDQVKDDLQDQLEITRIISGEYRLKFDSLCKKVKSIDERLSALEERSTLKPQVDGISNNLQSQPAANQSQPAANQGELYPDRIVSDRSVLCASSIVIRKCYDYIAYEETAGGLVTRVYHGDLYSDCNGYILLLHTKTRGVGGNTSSVPYQGSAPTPAPRLP